MLCLLISEFYLASSPILHKDLPKRNSNNYESTITNRLAGNFSSLGQDTYYFP
jgi:hypothetical protein